MQIVLGEIPEHGDIVDSGVDRRNRLFVEIYDANVSMTRRFYEDRRVTRQREQERNEARAN